MAFDAGTASPRPRWGRRLLLLAWAGSCLMLATWLVNLARFIWAPLPPGYSEQNMREGQGEGMAMVFFFFPGIVLFVVLLVVPAAVLVVLRRPASSAMGAVLPVTVPEGGAGWHPDPYGEASERWFDGNCWTGRHR